MAQRRMFSPDIVDSDDFLDMPVSSQLLYFHLGMRADDDGFISPKKVIRLINVGDDDLKVLLTKRFLLPFESGVVVVKHWLIHNLIRKDRYKETRYLEEKSKLRIKENGSYTEMTTIGLQNDNQMATQVRLGKVRLGKDIDSIPAHEVQVTPYKRLPIEKATLVQRLVYHLEDTLKTSIVNWGKQGKAVSSMIKAGYTEEQIKRTITYMAAKDEFFSDKGFDLTTVSNQIGRYKAQQNKNGLH